MGQVTITCALLSASGNITVEEMVDFGQEDLIGIVNLTEQTTDKQCDYKILQVMKMSRGGCDDPRCWPFRLCLVWGSLDPAGAAGERQDCPGIP